MITNLIPLYSHWSIPLKYQRVEQLFSSKSSLGDKEIIRMRSSLVVRASDCQGTSCNGPRFDPSIRRHSGIFGAADEAALNTVRKN